MPVTYATVIDKVVAGNHDHTVIHNLRNWLVQPFDAPDWLDLRVGFLLSLAGATVDDPLPPASGGPDLTETIAIPPLINPDGRYWIGVKDSSTVMPLNGGTVFIGFTNSDAEARIPEANGDSTLVSSDGGIGTGSTFWRPGCSQAPLYRTFNIFDGVVNRVVRPDDGLQQHFVQDSVAAGGYATLLMFRLQRPDASNNAKTITVTVPTGTHSTDVLYTNTPTELLLRANMEAFPTTVQTFGPVTLSAVPTAFYLYWPFHNSRIRNHCMGILKAR